MIIKRPLWGVTVGSCATGAREPGQGRKAAALSDACRVPQIAWPSLPKAGACHGATRLWATPLIEFRFQPAGCTGWSSPSVTS